MLRVRVGFIVADALQRVPTIEFFHSSRGEDRQALGWVMKSRMDPPRCRRLPPLPDGIFLEEERYAPYDLN